eukprot:SAG11_NODE_23572_length_386_cov_0.930314_1_plen_107_part_01
MPPDDNHGANIFEKQIEEQLKSDGIIGTMDAEISQPWFGNVFTVFYIAMTLLCGCVPFLVWKRKYRHLEWVQRRKRASTDMHKLGIFGFCRCIFWSAVRVLYGCKGV